MSWFEHATRLSKKDDTRPGSPKASGQAVLLTLCCAWNVTLCAADLPLAARLASELAAEGNHTGAAIEFRRAAIETALPEQRAVYHWAAAFEYFQADEPALCDKLLDRSEDDTLLLETETALLRGEAALPLRRQDAGFFFESVAAHAAEPEARRLAARRLARIRMLDGDPQTAAALVASEPAPSALAAIDTYTAGHDKTPWLGGLLGLVPGLGYAYSGEYANALRSLLLNSLFMYAMAATAEDDQWGAFSVITFFELTWYTGSIYGGVDAAHRYNTARLDACLEAIDGPSGFMPDYGALPIFSIQYRF